VPLITWSKRLFQDRIDFDDSLTHQEVQVLIADEDLKVLQCSRPVELKTWELLNDTFFAKRPEVELRVYGFYTSVCDLAFTSLMTNVHHFSADCLMDAIRVEHLGSMENLESLGVGIYHLESFDFLSSLTPRLKKLFLGRTKSKRPDLSPLSRFWSLEKIYLEGQQRNIEILSQLGTLNCVVLRSISTSDIGYLRPLERMWSLDIKLGGIKDLSAIDGMGNIKYLELWQIKGLSNIEVVSNLTGLQYLFLQSLRQVTQLPSLNYLEKLRRIQLDNMKGLIDISSLEFAPALEEFVHWGARNMQPEDYHPLLRNPSLKRAFVGFGSERKNRRFEELLQEHKLETWKVRKKFEFIL
jgi:hypothetical protein